MEIKKVRLKSNYLLISVVIGLVIGLVFYFDKKNNTENTMPIATILMSLAATVTFLYTIEKNKQQYEFIRKQQFESTFFNMMKQLEDIVSKLTISDMKSHTEHSHSTYAKGSSYTTRKYIDNITGRNVFDFLFNEYFVTVTERDIKEKLESSISEIQIYPDSIYYKNMMSIDSKIDSDHLEFKGVKSVITELGIKGYEGCSAVYLLDHYFRYLYRIMRFVDEADFLESSSSDITVRYKYMGILRATLSPYELVFLFYNDLSKYGNEKVKPLIEKYSFFKSLRKELLANTKIDYDLNAIKDDFDNDYDRYIEKRSPEKKHRRSFEYTASSVSIEDNVYLNNQNEN